MKLHDHIAKYTLTVIHKYFNQKLQKYSIKYIFYIKIHSGD